jgi:hypothetical protein
MHRVVPFLVAIGVSCALAGCSDSGGPSVTADAGPAVDGGKSADGILPDDGSSVDGEAPSEAPMIDEAYVITEDAFETSCPEGSPPTGGVGGGTDMYKVSVDITSHPDAVCNDGTPPVMFIRASTGGTETNKWLFHIQGGGGCSGEYQNCLDRWCGNAGYHAGKMSSKWTPDSMSGKGIMERSNENTFANANIVYMYYCSSDAWGGQTSDYVAVNPDDATQSYKIHFRGHSIAEAMVAQLLAGTVTSDGGDVTVPSLADATEVIITGTSGGSQGVLNTLDWMVSQLNPSTKAYGVFDASNMPLPEDIGDAETKEGILKQLKAAWERNKDLSADKADFIDQSCLPSNPAEPWLCYNQSYLRLNHVTTPFFQRLDLADPKIAEKHLGAKLMVNPTLIDGLSKVELGAMKDKMTEDAGNWSRTSLMRFKDVDKNATEKSQYTKQPGVFAQYCGQHVGLTNDKGWFSVYTMEDSAGDKLTFHDALRKWVDGAKVGLIDTVPSTLAVCGKTDGASD